MENPIMESINTAGEFANTSFNLADIVSKFTFWANDNPVLFRNILIGILAAIIIIPCVCAYKWNRN